MLVIVSRISVESAEVVLFYLNVLMGPLQRKLHACCSAASPVNVFPTVLFSVDRRLLLCEVTTCGRMNV